MLKNTVLVIAASSLIINPSSSITAHHFSTKSSLFRVKATQARNSISGRVTDTSNRSISELFVELQDDLYRTMGRVRISNSGRYIFNDIPAGNYKVKVLTAGTDYIEQIQEVTIVNFFRQTQSGEVVSSGSDSKQLDFVLRTKTGSSAASTNAPGVVFVQDVPTEAQKTYQTAVKELDVENRAEAGLISLKRAVDLFPRYYLALDRLGQEHVKRGEFEAARTVLTTAVEVNPRSYTSLYALGFAQHKLKQIPAAIQCLERSVSINPKSVNAQLWLGIALRQSGTFDKAEEHLLRAKTLSNSVIPETHWQLALLYNQTQKYNKAADELELFLKAQPDSRDEEKIKKLIQTLRSKKA
ncbi:MAG: tetratricopeptide repeat protein [Pyrinomonadaceae bacterium MAG19_C2-C3]|nr:tetratricopeptide repeat protein [Pyrinomonadaceae bacterium MAG19_C2-C3]